MLVPLLLALLLPGAARAQTAPGGIDLRTLCAGRESAAGAGVKLLEAPEGRLAVLDGGFCAAYLQAENETQLAPAPLSASPAFAQLAATLAGDSIPAVAAPAPAPAAKDKWKVRFYASNSFTTYFQSDVTFRSTRYNVEIKDYEWAERSSREFFEPHTWSQPGNNPAQILDEPTNTFVVSLEKDGHEFFLSAFHPKFYQAPDQVSYLKGTIDGVPVDGYQAVNAPFHGYVQTPGESKLARNENTYREMSFEIGYGHRIRLLSSQFGSITWVPGIAAGVMVGSNYTVMVQEGKWWDFDDHGDSYGVQGFGGSLTNRLEVDGPKERFGVFYENKLAYYKLKHGFMDGTQQYNLGFTGNSVGLKFMLYNPKNHRRSAGG